MKNYQQSRIIPEGSQEIARQDLKAVVYAGPGLKAKAYVGKSIKPYFHYRFQNQEQMNQKISSFFRRLEIIKAEKDAYKAEKAEFKTSLVVGDILYSSWGWEQTNIDFYQVIAVLSGGKSVRIVSIKKEYLSGDGFTGTCSPLKDQFDGEVLTKRVQPNNYITLNSYSCASKYNGVPKSYSSYA